MEAQRELQEELRSAPGGTLDAAPLPELPPLPKLPPAPAMPELPPLPPVPPTPPAPEGFHLGASHNQAIVLLALLILLMWWRGRGERAPRHMQ
jgi:hypothetical protein